MDQGGVDDQAPEAELVLSWWFCKPGANAFGLKSFSVLHMQCIETVVPLHRSLLVAIWLPNDLCILIVNFLCCACNFPRGGVKLDHQNDLWNGILFEGSYRVVVWQLFGFVILNDFYRGIGLLKQRGAGGEYAQRLLYQSRLSNTGPVSATVGTQIVKPWVWIWDGSAKHAILY